MDGTRLEHRHLRSALEFAVRFAGEGRKQRPPLPHPPAIKRYLSMPRVPTAALGALRRVVENDDAFRQRLAAGAVPELVDPIGLLWLTRPAGWEAQVDELVEAAERAEREADEAASLRRESKRRHAAEQAAARTRAHVVTLEARIAALTSELDDARADVEKLAELNREMRAELIDTRNDARHANDRADAAARRADQLVAERDRAVAAGAEAASARDDVLAERVDTSVEAARLAELAAAAQQLAAQLTAASELASDRRRGARDDAGRGVGRASPRRPLVLPGGVVGDSAAATEHLVRSGASILVDGYNVSMLDWSALPLVEQRRRLLDATENLARRHGADITVVFDGADVVGAAADARRLVRVVFSPPGVAADDVIRAEVGRLPTTRPVVVVTNDAAIVRDVRAAGANAVTSDRFLACARR